MMFYIYCSICLFNLYTCDLFNIKLEHSEWADHVTW